MPFSPERGSQNSLVTLTGQSLFTTSGIYLISGSTRGQCTIVSTGNSFTTFFPPSTPPGNLRSGNFQLFNLYGNATTSQYFTWIETPKISGINPSSGFSGNYFRISGSGIRDITGLWFNDLYTGVLTDAIFENSTWLRSGQIPFFSGGLNSYFSVKVMSEGGSSVSPTLYFVREDGLTLSGFSDFPTPFQPLNYLRENSLGTSLEWRTQTDVLSDISGVNVYGDTLSGDFYITGGKLNLTGLNIQNSGLVTGNMIFDTILSGGYIVFRAKIGGIQFIGNSLAYS